MLDQTITNLARGLIHPAIERRRGLLQAKIQGVRSEAAANGQFGSSRLDLQILQLCEQELRDRAQLAWEHLQAVHTKLGAPYTSTLGSDLKREAGIYCRDASLELVQHIPTRQSVGSTARQYPFDTAETQIEQELAGQIDLYVASLAIVPTSPTPSQKVSQTEIFESPFETYEIVGHLGEGGAGKVYSVRNINGERFALKCLSPERITTEKRKRFKNEIAFSTKYEHRNLIKIVDNGVVTIKDTKCPFYVMPEFPLTLRRLMDQGIGAERVLPLFSQVLDGIEAAHKLGVFHRDLKPENILYDQADDRLVLADFGIAHFEEDIIATEVETKAVSRMANFGYAAPEQKIKGQHVDHRADIFALGLILNELFTGAVPHGTGYKTVSSVAADHGYIDSLVDWMIKQDAAIRPESVEAIKKELIARGNTFVAMQRLEETKKNVVRAHDAAKVEPVKLVSADWNDGLLILELDRVPESGWTQWFQQPEGSWGSVMGASPEKFKFIRNRATIGADEQNAQQIVDFFKSYLEMATRSHQNRLDVKARQEEAQQRQQLQRELQAAETRARVVSNLKV